MVGGTTNIVWLFVPVVSFGLLCVQGLVVVVLCFVVCVGRTVEVLGIYVCMCIITLHSILVETDPLSSLGVSVNRSIVHATLLLCQHTIRFVYHHHRMIQRWMIVPCFGFLSYVNAFTVSTSLATPARYATVVSALPTAVVSMMPSANPANVLNALSLSEVDPAVSDAFQDEIQFLDTPIQLMLGIFGVVVVVLAALSVISAKVDDAITQTLRDFEKTTRLAYPQKWQEIQAQLDEVGENNAASDARDIKLLQIMESMQEKEPALMNRIRQKMDEAKGANSK